MDVVSVLLGSSARAVTCDANGHVMEVGDYCVVETDQGPRVGKVLVPTWNHPGWDGHPRPLRKVLRPATRADEEDLAYGSRREESALEDARERAARRGLPMRLTGTHQAPDRARITFYFTADGRVDFRELVRELAAHHRMRIEMRQIGARDDARARGGVGHCGRPLCCSTWLPEFASVSIRMAKSQGLSLSPSKISGQCGRLMCCLRYELDPAGRPLAGGGCGKGGGGCRRGARSGTRAPGGDPDPGPDA